MSEDFFAKFSQNSTTSEIGWAIAEIESNFLQVKNPISTAEGVFQITQATWQENCEGEQSEENNVKCGLQMIYDGELWRWQESSDKWLPLLSTSTRAYARKILILNSCVLYVRSRLALPPIRTPADLTPNIPACEKCAVLFSYKNGSHIAVVEQIFPGGMWVSETNWRHGQYTERFVAFDDPAFRGFYKYIPLAKR